MDKHVISNLVDDARLIASEVDLKIIDGKKILLTGASGLIGTHFLALLKVAAEKGYLPMQVVCITRSEPPPFQKIMMAGLNVDFLQCDISEPYILRDLPKFDFVIHAAGYAQPLKFLQDPLATIRLNTVGTFNLVEKMDEGGCFLFLSSSEVYTGLDHSPFSEEQIGKTSTTHQRACYIEGKRCGEAISYSYRLKGLRTKVARLALAYGPGTQANDLRVMNSVIQQGLTKGVIRLKDAGLAKRTYCYASDAISMMWNILTNGREFIYNVGGKSTITIGELACMVAEQLGVPLEIPQNMIGLEGAPAEVELNLNRVQQEFGKESFMALEEGITRTIAWQRELYL